MKHIYMCQHFVSDLQRQKKVGEVLQSEENMADRATKNMLEKLFAWHVASLKTRANLMSAI